MRWTSTSGRPNIASSPISWARRRLPFESRRSPACKSSPRWRTFSPGLTERLMVTIEGAAEPGWRLLESVSSTITTASASGGMGAPVMMRAASPGPRAIRASLPARISSTTLRATPGTESRARTAKPSTEELLKTGRSVVAFTSPARIQPADCSMGTVCDSTG